MTLMSSLEAAITAAGGTPSDKVRFIDKLAELVTALGGTPTAKTATGLIRQAITAAGGTATKHSYLPLLRELVTTLGGAPAGHTPKAAFEQIADLLPLDPYGPELVVKGTFDTNTTGWTAAINAVLSVVNGALRVTNGTASNGQARQAVTVEAGATYRYSIDVFHAASGFLAIGSTEGGTELVTTTSGGGPVTRSGTFVAPGATVYLATRNGTTTLNATRDFDNISLKKVL